MPIHNLSQALFVSSLQLHKYQWHLLAVRRIDSQAELNAQWLHIYKNTRLLLNCREAPNFGSRQEDAHTAFRTQHHLLFVANATILYYSTTSSRGCRKEIRSIYGQP